MKIVEKNDCRTRRLFLVRQSLICRRMMVSPYFNRIYVLPYNLVLISYHSISAAFFIAALMLARFLRRGSRIFLRRRR